jgi:hypothetical protein
MIDLQSLIDREIDSLQRHIVELEFERDNAATPTESAHDKTRQMTEQRIFTLQDQIQFYHHLRDSLVDHKTTTHHLSPLDPADPSIDICIVPEGLGGRNLGIYRLVSSETPIAKIICNPQSGQPISIGDKQYRLDTKSSV